MSAGVLEGSRTDQQQDVHELIVAIYPDMLRDIRLQYPYIQPTDAEDLVQQVIWKILISNIDLSRGEESVRGYIFEALNNACIDYLRRYHRFLTNMPTTEDGIVLRSYGTLQGWESLDLDTREQLVRILEEINAKKMKGTTNLTESAISLLIRKMAGHTLSDEDTRSLPHLSFSVEIFLRKVFLEQTSKAIAAELGITQKSVNRRMRETKQQIQVALAGSL